MKKILLILPILTFVGGATAETTGEPISISTEQNAAEKVVAQAPEKTVVKAATVKSEALEQTDIDVIRSIENIDPSSEITKVYIVSSAGKKSSAASVPEVKATAPAEDYARTYFSGKIGGGTVGFQNADTQPDGAMFALAWGIRVRDTMMDLRTEFEYAYFNSSMYHSVPQGNYDVDWDIERQTRTYLINTYVDTLSNYALHPFIGVGLGVLHSKDNISGWAIPRSYPFQGISVPSYSESDTSFTYGLHYGIGFNFTKNWSGEFAGRYFIANIWDAQYEAFGGTFGVRCVF